MQRNAPRPTPSQLRALDQLFSGLARPYELAEKTHCSIEKVAFDRATINRAHLATCELPKMFQNPRIRDHLRADPSVFLRHWEATRFWLIFFISYYSAEEGDGIPSQHRERDPGACVAKVICAIRDVDDSVFPSSGPLRQTIVSDKELFDAVARHWLEQDSKIYMGDSQEDLEAWLELFSPYPSRALSDLLMYTAMDFRNPFTKRLMKIADGDSDFIASTAVQRLRAVLRISSPSEVAFAATLTYMVLATNLFHPSEPRIQRALVNNKIVTAQAKAMRRCLQLYRSNTIDKRSLAEPTAVTMSVLNLAFSACPFPSTARQAIRGYIIESFVELYTSIRLPHLDSHERQYGIFTQILPGFLHVYPVLSDTIRAFKRLSSKQVRELQNVPQLRRLWNATVEKSICKVMFDNSWRYNKTRCRVCKKENSSIKVCGYCKSARYCSVECQKTDWYLIEHRSMCIGRQPETGNVKATAKAHEFLLQIAIHDIRHCFPGLLLEAEREFPGIPLNRLAIGVDYSHAPIGSLHPPFVSVLLPPENVSPFYTATARNNEMLVMVHGIVHKKQLKLPVMMIIPDPNLLEVRTANAREAAAYRNSGMIERTVKTSGLVRKPLKTMEWDVIDEVWARAIGSGGLIWDVIPRIVEEVLEEDKRREL